MKSHVLTPVKLMFNVRKASRESRGEEGGGGLLTQVLYAQRIGNGMHGK